MPNESREPSEVRWIVLDLFAGQKQVDEFTAPDRRAAEAEAQRRGFSLGTHRVESVLEFTTFKAQRPPRRHPRRWRGA